MATSLEIGRVLRQHKGLARLDQRRICGSACVFVLAGGAARIVEGDVLIHRPYLPDDQAETAAAQKRKYAQLRNSVVPYLEEMNVPAALYDDMIRIPPAEAKSLSAAELSAYGLSANDPFEDEATDVSLAKKLGISRQEYLRRAAEAKATCRGDDLPANFNDPRWEAWAECNNRVMGIPP